MQIELKDVSKDYMNKQNVLDHVNLKLEKGMFGLLGANGAGKTTLIRILATALEKTSGKILFDGEEKKEKEIRKKIGYIPQSFSFYPNMTVYQTLDYFFCLSEVKNDKKEKIDQLLEMVNLLDSKKKKTKELSGGMKQRLGIAVALIGDPEVLLVDEPTVGLDPIERMRFRNILVDFAQTKTVSISTHIVSDIEETCKNLAIMKDGKIIFQGSQSELYSKVKSRVWDVEYNDLSKRDIEEEYTVTSKTLLENGVKVRIISENKPVEHAISVEPNMQDAYIWVVDEDN